MRPVPRSDVDLVLLEQEVDALDVAVDRLVLERHHLRQVELRLRHADAHLRESRARLPRTASEACSSAFDGMQPIFRQVPPSVGALLDHGHLHAELRRADGADIAAGAGADDDEIVVSH